MGLGRGRMMGREGKGRGRGRARNGGIAGAYLRTMRSDIFACLFGGMVGLRTLYLMLHVMLGGGGGGGAFDLFFSTSWAGR